MTRASEDEARQLAQLRIASIVEATTLLVLIGIAVPLKHLAGWPLGVRLVGPVHGLAFVVYVWLVVRSIGAGLWGTREAALLILGSVVPFAGYFMSRLVARRQRRLLVEEIKACP